MQNHLASPIDISNELNAGYTDGERTSLRIDIGL